MSIVASSDYRLSSTPMMDESNEGGYGSRSSSPTSTNNKKMILSEKDLQMLNSLPTNDCSKESDLKIGKLSDSNTPFECVLASCCCFWERRRSPLYNRIAPCVHTIRERPSPSLVFIQSFPTKRKIILGAFFFYSSIPPHKFTHLKHQSHGVYVCVPIGGKNESELLNTSCA